MRNLCREWNRILYRMPVLCLLLWMVTFNGWADGTPKPDHPGDFECRTHPDKFQEEWLKHLANNQRQVRLNKAGFRLHPTANFDVGDIAVIEDDGTIVVPENIFDLDYKSLLFTPSAQGYDVTAFGRAFDPDLGDRLELRDDESVLVGFSPGFSFSFYGVPYTGVFVNDNGNLTFGVGDRTSRPTPLRLLAGPPRIAPFWDDLVSERGRGVFVKQSPEKLTVTWSRVPEYFNSGPNTFQVTLWRDGRILFTYYGMAALNGLTGLSPGGTSQGQAVNLRDLPITGLSGALYELFTPYVDIDILNLARKFYQTHPDIYDSLITWTGFDLGGLFAFFAPAKNDVEGIGQRVFDQTALFGSRGRLGGLILMNHLHIWPADPYARLYGFADSMLSILGQEQGHRWMAFPYFERDGVISNELLGRDGAHWSFFHNTESTMSTAANPRASAMEGNVWLGNGDQTFTTTSLVDGYSPLDQYLMGLRDPAEVPDFSLILRPGETALRPGSTPAPNQTVRGTRQVVTLNQIISVEGPRVPDAAGAPKNFRSAFILLLKRGTRASALDLERLELYRTAWQQYFAQATDGRATVSTELKPSRAIAAMDPPRGVPGRTLEATITGVGLGNSRAVEFTGAGVTATIRPGGDDTRLPVAVTVDAGASPGVRRFRVTTADGVLNSESAAFQVTNFSTQAGGARGFFAVAVGPAGDLYGSETLTSGTSTVGRILRIAPDGAVSVFAEGFLSPTGLAFNRAGDLFVADLAASTISRLTPGGQRSLYASGLMGPVHLAFDGNGNLYVANYYSPEITRITPGGQRSPYARIPDGAFGLAFDSSGRLYASDFDGGNIYVIDTRGAVQTFASPGVYTEGLAVDAAGHVFVGNGYVGAIFRIDPTGEAATLGNGLFTGPVGLTMTAAGELLAVGLGRPDILRFVPSVATEPPGAPRIGRIGPRIGAKGSSVMAVIYGTGLRGAQSLSFRGRGVTGEVVDASLSYLVRVRVTIADDAEPGPHSFMLTTARGPVSSGLMTFVVQDPPSITALAPDRASVGQALRFRGRGFPESPAGAGVVFSQGMLDFYSGVSLTRADWLLTALPRGLTPGAARVRVLTNQGISPALDLMVGEGPAAPVITAVSPATPAPGQRVFIQVDGLPAGNAAGSVSVSIDSGAGKTAIPLRVVTDAPENGEAVPRLECCAMETPGPDARRLEPPTRGRLFAPQPYAVGSDSSAPPQERAAKGSARLAAELPPLRRLGEGLLVELPSTMPTGEARLTVRVSIDGQSSPASAPFRLNISGTEPSSFELKGVTPHVRGVGQLVMIRSPYGEGFTPVLSNNIARFFQGERSFDSPAIAFVGTDLVFPVPAGLAPGTAQVFLVVLWGPGRWSISGLTSITITAPPPRPAIDSVTPAAAGPGATIRIRSGFGSFATVAENNTVTFIQGARTVRVRATAVDPLADVLTVTVPDGLTPGGADVTVTSTFDGVETEPSRRFHYRITGGFVYNVPILLNGYTAVTDDNYVTGIAIANPGEQSARVSFTAYSADGTVMRTDPNPVEVTIGPHEQIPITFADLMGLGVVRSRLGWVQIRSNGEVKGLFLIFDRNFDRIVDGAEVTSETSTPLIFPHLEFNPSNGKATFYALANPNLSAVDVLWQSFDGAGQMLAQGASPLPALGSTVLTMPPADRRGGFLKITAAQPVSGLLWFGNALQLSALKAQPLAAAADRLVFPHYAASDGMKTDVSITNVSAQEVELSLTAFNDAGQALGQVTRRLPPNAQLLESAAGLFGWPEEAAVKTGYLVAQGNGRGLVGFTNFVFQGGDSAAVPAESAPRTRLVFSHVAHNVPVERGRSLLTGLALVNPTATAATLTMSVVNGRGQTVARKSFVLPASQRMVRFLSHSEPGVAFFDPEITLGNGHIVVTSNTGLMGFELFFTNDLLESAAVPAQ